MIRVQPLLDHQNRLILTAIGDETTPLPELYKAIAGFAIEMTRNVTHDRSARDEARAFLMAEASYLEKP